MPKPVLFFICMLSMPICVVSQQLRIEGTIVNSITGFPIEDVNLKIANSNYGNSTNRQGQFNLGFAALPVLVEISCIGYEPISIEISKPVAVPVTVRLKPIMQLLDAVTISERKAVPVYEDADYSVLDYEIMGDNLLVLVFRYRLNRCTLLLLTRWGDTLARTALPEVPPSRLYKDPLGNIHYFSKAGNAYQCYYNQPVNEILFIYQYSVDTVLKTFAGFQFVMNKRLFFSEKTPSGFSTQFGCIDNQNGKKYLKLADNSRLSKQYYSDLSSFLEPRRPDDVFLSEENMRAFELFYKPKSNALMVRAGPDRIAVFDFTNDTLQLLNSDWKILSTSIFSFHKEIRTNLLTSIANAFTGSQWKWRWDMYADGFSGKVYARFDRHGQTRLSDIDLLTGKVLAEYELPVLFVEKITIYKGEAFFRYKVTGEGEKWRLYKMRL